MEQLTEQQLRDKISGVFAEISKLCREAGCHCLAERLRGFEPATHIHTDACCPDGSAENKLRLHLLAKLTPLVKLLHETGYHDLALETAQLAMELEPTMDMELRNAYLNLLLGENEAALKLYSRVIKERGSIPARELKFLAQLIKDHASEDDLRDIYQELEPYAS